MEDWFNHQIFGPDALFLVEKGPASIFATSRSWMLVNIGIAGHHVETIRGGRETSHGCSRLKNETCGASAAN